MPTALATTETLPLCLAAVTVGVVHTLLGPDHYVPFVAMSRADGWPLGKTLRVTTTCGMAHVAGSVVIGLVGLSLGLAVMQLEHLEAFRGDVAAWLMIGFGAASMTWGLVRASRAKSGAPEHAHPHATAPSVTGPVWTPWLLFLVFAFGPCEPLIPLLMYPASKASWWAVVAVAVAFAAATVATMAVAVIVLRHGVSWLPAAALQRHAHTLAGAAILACGLLITLGL